jgi:hypothetical protein
MSATTHGVQRVIPIDLPRPRDELVETTAEFLALERELRLELRKSSKQTERSDQAETSQ